MYHIGCMEGVFVPHPGTLHCHRWDHVSEGAVKEQNTKMLLASVRKNKFNFMFALNSPEHCSY